MVYSVEQPVSWTVKLSLSVIIGEHCTTLFLTYRLPCDPEVGRISEYTWKLSSVFGLSPARHCTAGMTAARWLATRPLDALPSLRNTFAQAHCLHLDTWQDFQEILATVLTIVLMCHSSNSLVKAQQGGIKRF